MTLEPVRQTAWLIVALLMMIVGLGLALVLESGVLLGVVVILPFLTAIWLARNHQLNLTRRCLESYRQKRQSLKR